VDGGVTTVNGSLGGRELFSGSPFTVYNDCGVDKREAGLLARTSSRPLGVNSVSESAISSGRIPLSDGV